MIIRQADRFEDWRATARELLTHEVPPQSVLWQEASAGQAMLTLASEPLPPASTAAPARVSRGFLAMAEKVACHRSPQRWEVLYRLLWRTTHGEAELLDDAADEDVHAAHLMQKAVARDIHKTHAFVRFSPQQIDGHQQWLAWHRPDHRTLRLAVPHFVERFAAMQWTIFTPDETAVWDGRQLSFGPGVAQAKQGEDDLVELWRTYYGHIFNPARIKLKAMRREMPERFWSSLPETTIMNDLLAAAPARVEAMIAHQQNVPVSAEAFLPDERHLTALAAAAACCQGCPLHASATQTVFGVGPANARLMFVGEQPGDHEDRAGAPFVGPAGQLLDRALAEAGIDRAQAYLTNAVKHFKWTPRGTRRLHAKPNYAEVVACRPWLQAELLAVQPQQLVCLGATAAQSLFGGTFRITQQRGKPFASEHAPWTMATYHPSAVLRATDSSSGERIYRQFVDDLRLVARQLAASTPAGQSQA